MRGKVAGVVAGFIRGRGLEPEVLERVSRVVWAAGGLLRFYSAGSLLAWLGDALEGSTDVEEVRGAVEKLDKTLESADKKNRERLLALARRALEGKPVSADVLRKISEAIGTLISDPEVVGRGLSVEVEGDARAGVYSRVGVRVCHGLGLPFVFGLSECDGGGIAECRIVEGRVESRGECVSRDALVVRSNGVGDIPITIRGKVAIDGFESGVEKTLILKVSGPPAGAPGGEPPGYLRAEELAAEKPTAMLVSSLSGGAGGFVGLVLEELRFRPARPRRLERPLRVGGLEARSVIGVGGFAATRLAVDDVGEQYVVKVPAASLHSLLLGAPFGGADEASLRKEARVLEGLSHVHLVRFYGYGVDRETGIPYLVLEYCPRGSLRGVLREMGRLDWRTAAIIGVQVASALEYLHGRGVVHRDLKPENILFTREGLLKLTDFNISKIMASATLTSTGRAYTPGYAAPEQIVLGFGRTGPWTDVWSLGVLLYEIVEGRLPISREKYLDPDPSTLRPAPMKNAPKPLENIITTMLTTNPKDRPSATEVIQALEKLL